ncbi:uncharacterized protein LOC119723484 [Patiria miniata]|uniref:S1 motif domain-containing protein n=1 Tax=Patiria miniata TaxID=46514 RepID=A0A913ZE72_PATMI|nr:uncharacterized protein LOC119723484 [Patiria miniata]
MDRSLFEGAVKLHGLKLDRLVKEEQGASFLDDVKEINVTEDVMGALNDENTKSKGLPISSVIVKVKAERKRSRDEKLGDDFTNKLHGFIAKKADLLFRQQNDDEHDEDAIADKIPSAKDAEKLDYYAILPPLEQFLEVDPDVSQERLFDILKVGDAVVGQILSTKNFGIFVKLLALCQDTPRFLDECEVVALLPTGELRDKFSHVASIDDFQIGDLLRALVIKVNAEEQKVIISLHAKDDSQDVGSLGLITESELPVYYRRSVLQIDTQEAYQDMLHNSVGFDNPFNVAYLGDKLGLKDTCPLSLMRGLQRSNFPEKEYAEPLRKWQTNRWSMESVAKGVEHFKAGRLLDAMQHLNKALEIDEENVEALVARGALYANKDLLSKALQDFGKALKINPNHRNANRYMCQTLVERGKQHEEAGEKKRAAECYQTAVDIKPDFLEAQLCLDNINKTRRPAKKVTSPTSISSPSPNSPEVKLSVAALRQLVDPENEVSKSAKKSTVKTKKKKKRKEHEKDRSSRKKDKEDKQGRSQSRSVKKEGRYSSPESSETPSARSRSRNRSGKKDSGDGRKYDKSLSRESKKEAKRRVSRQSASYSRSSSSDRSRSQSLRSRSHQLSGRKASKHAKKRKGRRSSSISRSSSSGSSQSPRYRSRSRSKNRHLIASTKHTKSSSKRKLEVKPTGRHSVSRSRSRSPYTVSESSLSPQRSKSRSLDRSRRKSRTEERGSRSTRNESKTTGRSPSHSISPGTRHRTLSGGSKESRSSKTDSMKAHGGHSLVKKLKAASGVRETKESSQSRSKSDSRQHSSRTDDREDNPTDGTFKSKMNKNLETSTVKSSSLKRKQDVHDVSDDDKASRRLKKRGEFQESEELDKVKLKDGKYRHQSTTETGERARVEKKRTGLDRRCTHSDTESSSKESDKDQSKKHLRKTASQHSFHSTSDRSKNSAQSSQGAKSHDRRGDRRPSLGDHHRRSRSRSFSSDGSYSNSSYSSYSVSGSRSYSYSSYSSSGSYSDSDDSRKDSRHKSDKSKSCFKQTNKPASKSKTSEVREDRYRNEPGSDEEDDSDSDVDTGIYEISRDHLEMYMDSKSYQLKKEDDVSPLKRKKRLRSDEDEVVSDKKIKPEKRRGKETSDDDKKEKIASFSHGKKESQKGSRSEAVPPPKGDSKVPVNVHLPPPSRTVATVSSLKESSHAASVYSSLLPAPNRGLEPHIQAVQHQSPGPNVGIAQSRAPIIGLNQSAKRKQEVEEQPAVLDRFPHIAGRADTIHQQQQHSVSENQQPFTSGSKGHRSGPAGMSLQDKIITSHRSSTGRAYEVEPSQTFTPEQLSVLDSISKQLAQTRQETSHAASSEKPVDANPAQYHQKHERDQVQGSSEVTNPVQGHQIGVIMTHRSSDIFGQSDNHQETFDGTNPSFDDHHARNRRGTGRWDVKIPEDGGFDSGHLGGSEFFFADSKPIPISIDYQHGKDISSSFDIEPEDYREREAFVSGLPTGSVRHIQTHGMDCTGGSALEIEKLIKESREHSCQISEDLPRHRGHHSSRGERSRDRPRGESSDFRTYGTRHDHSESKNVDANKSASKVPVVDYQHGQSGSYHERQRCTSDEKMDYRYERRHHDRVGGRHPGNHRSAPERHHHRGPRSYEQKSVDRPYHERDRHGNTQRDRHHSRSSGTHGGRRQKSATPVEPKESNPFLQLVSSTKDMQVASLHSEGKWGPDSSPEDMKSSSRSWWL